MGLRRLREHRSLRRRVEQALEAVQIPQPWNIEEFARRLGDSRGRHLELLPTSMPLEGPDAVWLAGPTVDLIVYDGATNDLHREHVILHELCHILLCHRGTDDVRVEPSLLRTLGLVEPDADTDTDDAWHSALHRVAYDDNQERDAELAATLVWQKAGLRLAPSEPRLLHGPDADAVDRLADVMERFHHA
jgi:hypothetical protein